MSSEPIKSPLPGFSTGAQKLIEKAIEKNDLEFFYKLYLSKMVELSLTGRGKEFYEHSISGVDDSPYEHLLPGKLKPTFPYDLKNMSNTEGVTAAGLFPYTPFANTMLADFAIKSIDAEGLGLDDQTDMLCISFSTPDIIGHAFGPYSIEIEDTYLRLDKEIALLLQNLEKKVGKKDFVMFITADHAVVPVPQNLMDKGI